ncbi:oligosaccharide flippase family protein [Aphanothece sacrum]|uniref:Polysaccharide biosynthesis protein n=1 Tax=Aphanothece sacrum FPU1 TaxID=1920663 RepID=A0A401IJS7_APHSA|nr:oligosaccharide flippase family protein [Aphanothece sacrum]GBF81430.1 polysaccharide biosynthesis protein [Aphanothece sacrum FPU1]GBF85561.1 polysaccharide biosynthesis protein [Aphanothece sacrum FPU3]
MSSIKQKAISGTIWTLIGYGGAQVLRLGSNIILTRLLVPELFGLMALVNTFIQGLNLFSDIGVRPSIIRSPRGDDPIFINTAWTLTVIRGFILWFACCVIAWPVAHFYGKYQFLWLLPIVGLTTIMSGFASTALATLNRKMDIEKITKYQFIIQSISISVMIVWAYFQRSIWALIAGTLISSFINMVMSHRLEPKISNRFAWDQESLKELISFGRWIFVATAMAFLADQADTLMLGKFLSLEMLGVYIIAFTFSDLPRKAFRQVSQQIMMPIIAQQIDLPREILRAKILKARWLILVALAVIVSLLFCGGDFIILTLYDKRYKEAAWMLPLLSLGLWPLMLSITVDKSLYALGKPFYPALGNCFKFLYMLLFLPMAFLNFGFLGAIWVIVLNDFPYYITINFKLWKEKLSCLSQDLQATLLLVALIIIEITIRNLLGFGSPIDGLKVYL